LPKRNYSFEKRQKDLKKKQKQEDKLRRRLERRAGGQSTADGDGEVEATDLDSQDSGAEPLDRPPEGEGSV